MVKAYFCGIITLLVACGAIFNNANDARAAACAFYAQQIGSNPNWFQQLILLVAGQSLTITNQLWSSVQTFFTSYLAPAIIAGSDVVTVSGTATTAPVPSAITTILPGYYPMSTTLLMPITYSVPSGASTGYTTIMTITMPVSYTNGTVGTAIFNLSFNGSSMYVQDNQ